MHYYSKENLRSLTILMLKKSYINLRTAEINIRYEKN